MKNVADAREPFDGFGAQQTMRIRNDANLHDRGRPRQAILLRLGADVQRYLRPGMRAQPLTFVRSGRRCQRLLPVPRARWRAFPIPPRSAQAARSPRCVSVLEPCGERGQPRHDCCGLHFATQVRSSPWPPAPGRKDTAPSEVCKATNEAIPNSPQSGTVWAVTIRQEALLPT